MMFATKVCCLAWLFLCEKCCGMYKFTPPVSTNFSTTQKVKVFSRYSGTASLFQYHPESQQYLVGTVVLLASFNTIPKVNSVQQVQWYCQPLSIPSTKSTVSSRYSGTASLFQYHPQSQQCLVGTVVLLASFSTTQKVNTVQQVQWYYIRCWTTVCQKEQ